MVLEVVQAEMAMTLLALVVTVGHRREIAQAMVQ
jgi:hypothetical protein